MKTLFETKNCRPGHYENHHYRALYVEHNGKKFRLICETENGEPCGFKSNKCIQVMTSDGNFVNVADCIMIGYPYQNRYLNTEEEELQYSDGLFKAFKNFIQKVY